MNIEKLKSAIRELKNKVGEIIDEGENIPEIEALSDDLRDVKELLIVLAHVVDGKTIAQAFGSPGDWGHDTPIGKALTEV